jgi:glutaredoxin 3|tara:strand:+ start:3960 stop:4223 length:264 start_codon:yes stop_codon:yes gene_type:complete
MDVHLQGINKIMKVEIYSKPQCPYCVQAKALAEREGYELTYKMLDEDFNRETLMETFPGARTFPQIIVDGEKIGGFTEFKALVDASK